MSQEKTRRREQIVSATETPSDVVLTATDPLGMTVYLSQRVVEGEGRHSQYHPEHRDLEGTREAIETPVLIAEHVEHSDRRLYLGPPKDPGDIALAPVRRLVVAAVKTANTAEVITLYDHARSRPPASLGAVLYDAERSST